VKKCTCLVCDATKTKLIDILTIVAAEVTSYNKNLQDKLNQNLIFAVTITLSDGSTYVEDHSERVNGGQKGNKTFDYGDYKVYVEWNDNNKVTKCEVI